MSDDAAGLFGAQSDDFADPFGAEYNDSQVDAGEMANDPVNAAGTGDQNDQEQSVHEENTGENLEGMSDHLQQEPAELGNLQEPSQNIQEPDDSADLFAPNQESADLFGGIPETNDFTETPTDEKSQGSEELFGANQNSADLFGGPQDNDDVFGESQENSEHPDSACLFGTTEVQDSASLFGGSPEETQNLGSVRQDSSELFGNVSDEAAELFGSPQAVTSGAQAPIFAQTNQDASGLFVPSQNQPPTPVSTTMYVPGMQQATQPAPKQGLYIPGIGVSSPQPKAPPPQTQPSVMAHPPAAVVAPSAPVNVYVPGGFQQKNSPAAAPSIFMPSATPSPSSTKPPEMQRPQLNPPGNQGSVFYVPGIQQGSTPKSPAMPNYVPGQPQAQSPPAPGYVPGMTTQTPASRPAVFSPAHAGPTPSAPPPMNRPPPMVAPVTPVPEQVQKEEPKPSYVPGLVQLQQQEQARKPPGIFQPASANPTPQVHGMNPPPMVRPPPMPQGVASPQPEPPKMPVNMPKFDIPQAPKLEVKGPSIMMPEGVHQEQGNAPAMTPGFQKPPQFTAPPKMPSVNAPSPGFRGPSPYFAPMQPVAADSKQEIRAVASTPGMSRSVTTNQISGATQWSAPLPTTTPQPFVHSVSQPCDVVHSNIPFFTKRRPINAFGFGGLIVRSKGGGVVLEKVQELYSNDSVVEQLAAFGTMTQPGEIETYINDRLTKCESEEDSLLWQTIGVRVSQEQTITPSAFHQNLRIHGSSEQRLLNMLSQSVRASDVSPSYTESSCSSTQLEQLQRIITENGDRDALEFAISNSMWPFAMIIASAISTNEMQRVSSMFISQTLSPCSLSRVLSTLSGMENEIDEHNWKDSLYMSLKHYGSNTSRSLRSMAQYLESIGKVKCAHVCKLLASDQLEGHPSNFSLVGTEWNRPTITAVQMSQLSMKVSLGFYPYAVYYTMALIDFGFTDKAKMNADRLKERFEREKILSFLHVADLFQKRLARITRKPDEGVVKALFSGVDKLLVGFVLGDEPRPADEHKPMLPSSVATDKVDQSMESDFTDPFGGMEETMESFESSPVIAPEPHAMPQPQPKAPEPVAPTPPVSPKPQPQATQTAAKSQPEKQGQPQKGFFGRIFSKMNPFNRSIEVDLSEHDGEMVWDGTRYVLVSGGDEEQVSAPPPPPPKARVVTQAPAQTPAPAPGPSSGPPVSAPASTAPPTSAGPPPGAHAPPPTGMRRAGGRASVAGRYVTTF